MDEVRAAFRRLGGPEMVKQLGQVHKRVGELVISRAGGAQTGVGEGTGSTIRPSATTREVVLRVGGRHRERIGRPAQWGVRETWTVAGDAPVRPHLIGAAEAASNEVINAYIDGVNAVGKIHIDRR